MIEDRGRELKVRQVLRRLARQRVALVAQPGNVWIIEKALQRDADCEVGLATYAMRGWVEPLYQDLPTNGLSNEGTIAPGLLLTRTESYVRLTEGGWSAIYPAQARVLVNALLAVASLGLGLVLTG